VEELERLKTDLSLEDSPKTGAPPPVPNASRPGGGLTNAPPIPTAGKTAKALYEYEAAEDNELSFAEDEVITQIEEVDEGWWSGTNARGQSGLFPSNYVELLPPSAGDESAADVNDDVPPPPPPPPAPPARPGEAAAAREEEEVEEGEVMIAAYDYEAAEDNEIGFTEGDKIINIEKVDTDWWQGTCKGKTGLFPAAYVVPADEYEG